MNKNLITVPSRKLRAEFYRKYPAAQKHAYVLELEQIINNMRKELDLAVFSYADACKELSFISAKGKSECEYMDHFYNINLEKVNRWEAEHETHS